MKRRLDHERGETDRLSEEAAAERLKARQLEREVEQLHTDLEEYRWVHENFRPLQKRIWGFLPILAPLRFFSEESIWGFLEILAPLRVCLRRVYMYVGFLAILAPSEFFSEGGSWKF